MNQCKFKQELGKRWNTSVLVLVVCLTMAAGVTDARRASKVVAPTSFFQTYQTTSDNNHARILNNGQQVQLVLDQQSASGFQSNSRYLFGDIGMSVKLVPGNSAGTVTSLYLSSLTANHDELDFEFLGNVSGQPYILQTNVFAQGVGNREQRISLWFDPTAAFHRYSVSWKRDQVIFLVDNIPIRMYKNLETLGVAYPNSQPMGVFTSLWNGDQWATQGGAVKLNWTYAPFIATYTDFTVNGCPVVGNNIGSCTSSVWAQSAVYQSKATPHQVNQLSWVRRHYLIYNYCADRKRFPTVPIECAYNPL